MKRNLGKRILNKIPNFTFIVSLLVLFTILCFMFPEYLTTPEIRSKYPIPLFRILIYWSEIISGIVAAVSLLLLPKKHLSILTLMVLLICVGFGGSEVYLKEEYDSFPIRIGLDWFILDLFLIAVFFIPLEGLLPRHKGQRLVRAEFKTDLIYFAFTHLGIQLIFLVTQVPADIFLEFFRIADQSKFISSLNLAVQVLIALFVADLTQYWVHRLFHKSAILWEFHKIHHSIKTLDWLSGSRLHLVDITVVRSLIYIAVIYLGLSSEAFVIYLLITAFQTILSHSNVGVNFGFLRYLLVTPQFHHWHHNDRPESYDKNFAIHFPLIDLIFGTYFLPGDEWPGEYGVENYPVGFFRQMIEPFKRIWRRREE